MSRLFFCEKAAILNGHILYIRDSSLHRFFTKNSKNVLTECAYIPKLKLAVNVSGNDSRISLPGVKKIF